MRSLFLASACVFAATAAGGDLERIRYNNPGLTVDLGVGLWAWPLPMDYDGDGDLDLVVSSGGKPYEGTYFFENPGGGKMPVFKPARRIGDYKTNVQVSPGGEVLTPGQFYPRFLSSAFEHPVPVGLTTGQVYSSKGRVRANQWKYIDYDADGDLDLTIGIGDWVDYGWDDAYNSQGEWTNGPLHGYVYLALNEDGAYSTARKVEAGGKPVDVYGMPSPNFADFDGDGDLDLICGEFLDGFTYFENVGTRTEPRYAAGRKLDYKGKPIAMDLQMITPTAVDWDGDGDPDLIVGDEDGRVAFVENRGKARFLPPKYFQQEADYVKFGALVTPVGHDWDGDGDEDLIAGNTAGYIGFIENLDGGDPPKWAAPVHLKAGGKTIRIQAGPNGSIQGPCEAKWGYTTLSVADWDGDGLADLVVNSIWGKVVWFRNVGTPREAGLLPAQPVLAEQSAGPDWNWWQAKPGEFASQWRTTPAVIDWDRDGLMDLAMLDHEGFLALFRRGSEQKLLAGQRIFQVDGPASFDRRNQPLSGGSGLLRLNAERAGKSGRRKICFADWDGDGRQDLLVNSVSVDWFRNLGDNRFAHEGALTGEALAGHTTSPTTVDWDGDGVRDLLVGAEDGFLYRMRNPRGR